MLPDTTPPLPDLKEAGSFYWQSGQQGNFTLGWCESCQTWLHPAREICPQCFGAPTSRVASGRASLLSYTINHQPWLAQLATPYTVAIVSPVEAPEIHLTTALVNCKADEIQIGIPLEVVFKNVDDTWLPYFQPLRPQAASNKPETFLGEQPPSFNKLSSKAAKYERQCAFTGMGKSAIGRNLGRTSAQLTNDAALAAIADSGLRPEDIDGISAYPGSTGLPGMSQGGVRELAYQLGLKPTWHAGSLETPGQGGALIAAMLAIAGGLCKHVLCFSQFSASARPLPALQHQTVAGEPRWSLPYGCVSPANWIALYANRYFQRYQADETLLGAVAIAERKNALLNPDALYKEPLDMAGYLSSRKITTPFKLADCDTPCDGAIAFVLSSREAAQDCPHKPVYVEACGTAFAEIQAWDQGIISYQPNILSASQHLWSRTDLKPKDVTIALLYDGFTFNVICWLEALGFCEAGGAADFIGDGSVFSATGKLPLNTHGGHLNSGRSNGYGQIYEAISQLRGNTGLRQVANAQLAAVSSGGGIPACAMLLSNCQG